MQWTAYNQLVTVPRRVWDPTEAAHPQSGSRPIGLFRGVEVHWPAANDLDDWDDTTNEALAWERYHEGPAKRWTDLFYNLVGDTQGSIYEGRDITVASQGDLTEWVTLLIHHGINDDLTDHERDVFGFLIWKAWGAATDGARQPQWLRGHGERPGASTSCPGAHLLSIVDDLRNGWVPPQATKGPPEMFIQSDHVDHEQATYFRVVRPQGVANPGSRDHWHQVVTDGHATGTYVSEYWDALDEITVPHPTPPVDIPEPEVAVLKITRDDAKMIAEEVVDEEHRRLEG